MVIKGVMEVIIINLINISKKQVFRIMNVFHKLIRKIMKVFMINQYILVVQLNVCKMM